MIRNGICVTYVSIRIVTQNIKNKTEINPKLVEEDRTSHERKCMAGKERNGKRPKVIYQVQIQNNEQGTLLVIP